jgi:hypothetical protein
VCIEDVMLRWTQSLPLSTAFCCLRREFPSSKEALIDGPGVLRNLLYTCSFLLIMTICGDQDHGIVRLVTYEILSLIHVLSVVSN